MISVLKTDCVMQLVVMVFPLRSLICAMQSQKVAMMGSCGVLMVILMVSSWLTEQMTMHLCVPVVMGISMVQARRGSAKNGNILILKFLEIDWLFIVRKFGIRYIYVVSLQTKLSRLMNIYFGWFVFGSICVCNKEYNATD